VSGVRGREPGVRGRESGGGKKRAPPARILIPDP